MKPKILCITDYYLPGFKGGGPIRSIANIVAHLSDDFEFWIVTRDRDANAFQSYPNVLVDKWSTVDQAKVFYASPEKLSFAGLMSILRSTQYDALYLNSFFSPRTTIQPLLIRYLGLCNKTPVVLAPRGEFSVGALALKSSKKSMYLALIRGFRLYKDLFWQASSEYEVEDIYRALPSLSGGGRVQTAPDLLPVVKVSVGKYTSPHVITKTRVQGALRLVFLSRISPKKNIDYLLCALKKIVNSVEVSIYGPIEDIAYWALCQEIIQNLPSNVSVIYRGEVVYENVAQTFAEHDLFVFPTHGENFGHVIYEALSVGTSVVVSDQTPWQEDSQGALQVLSLDQPEAWTAAINKWSAFGDNDFAKHRSAAVHYAIDYAATSIAVQQNRSLFNTAIGRA